MTDTSNPSTKKNQLSTFFSRFPESVLALALVSFLMNVSTSIVTSTAPNFVRDNLKNDVYFLVTIRSLAEGFSYFIKVFVGIFSDITKKRKLFLMVGYGGVLIVKPLFILVTLNIFSPSINSLIYAFSQISDRLLNATRDTPRDSLIADATLVDLRSQSFGLRRFFASLGSQCGGLLALTITLITSQYSILYTIASLPAFYSVYILYTKVKEPESTIEEEKTSWFCVQKLLEEKVQLRKYIFFMFIIFVLSFGKFNEICLFQVASSLGYTKSSTIILYMFFYTVVAFSSYCLSSTQRKDHISLLLFSIICLFLTNLLMGLYTNIVILIIGTIFSGIYVGITESVICGTITIMFPTKNMRSTLLGIMNLVLGISICCSGSLIATLGKYLTLQKIYLYGTIPPLLAFISFIFFYTFVYMKEPEEITSCR